MTNHLEKAKELIEQLNQLNNVDEKKKKKHLKCLQNILSGRQTGDPIIQMLSNSECIISAFNFIASNGKESFDQMIASTSKSKLVPLFIKFQKSFTDEEYWDNLGYVYVMQDFEQIDYNKLKKLFCSKRKNREFLMSEEEREFLRNLPEEIEIFRGGGTNEVDEGFGISWSLNKGIAEKFAKNKSIQTGNEMTIHKLRIKKTQVVAFLNSRKEEEIIYLG